MADLPTAPLAEVQVLHKSSGGGYGGKGAATGEAVSLAGRGAAFKSQAGALFRKNAVFQRRNWGSNLCLLSAPIFFCLLLFGIQMAINNLLLTGEDYAVRVRAVGGSSAQAKPQAPSPSRGTGGRRSSRAAAAAADLASSFCSRRSSSKGLRLGMQACGRAAC